MAILAAQRPIPPESDPEPIRLIATRGRRTFTVTATLTSQYIRAIRASGWQVREVTR